MKPNQIKGLIQYHGLKPAEIAEKLHVTRQAVLQVINRKSTSRRIMLALAEAIGLPPAEVFPEKAPLFETDDSGKLSQNIPQSKVA